MIDYPKDEKPLSLNPTESINKIYLKNEVKGIRKINKKGLILSAALIGTAAVVAVSTFNQVGSGASDAAKSAVSDLSKTNLRPSELNRDVLWYANQPDKIEIVSKYISSSNKSKIPDLTGQQISPIVAATAGQIQVPDLVNHSSDLNTSQNNLRQEQPDLFAQRKQQELDAAMKAGLTATGFSNSTNLSQMNLLDNNRVINSAHTKIPTSLMSSQDDQNQQDRKDTFLRSAKNKVDLNYSQSQRIQPYSSYEVKAGSVIPAVMISGINSDLPGQVIAQVRENVYDTKSGQYLLIPQGSRIIGLYDSHIAYGQKRVLLAWNRLIYPDGSSFDLKGMPGTDKGGYAGFFDQVDNHYFKIFGSAIMMSLISASIQLSQPKNGNSTTNNQAPSVSQTIGAALGQQIGQTSMAITQKNINIQPTLEIRPGYLFNIMVTADMIMPPAQ